jgi:putative membrane-bound dehydrogenase-like protein
MFRRSWPLLTAFALSAVAAPSPEEFASPAKSVGLMKLPEGFRVQLVAGEPDFIKPIAMTTDARGRVWVVESHSYPHWLTDGKKPGKDRVLIFEPTETGWKGKVFLEKGVNLSGIAVGHGGVWIASVPNILFVPTDFGTDKPTGPAKVLLDGWSLKTKHNVVNNLIWGPDGWLYGLNGIQSESRVGAPGTPEAKRTKMDCGVWRFHPTARTFEAVAHGTTNPWGLDWDDHGELFITNCVIKHLFHVVPGAHFVRMYGQDISPHSYGLIESCADHIHWAGGAWTEARGGKIHSDAGGGHAHAGAMFYLGDQWPAEYRNRILMANLHGNRLNANKIERKGSGYVAKRAPDFLFANDPWFRGLSQMMSPDGGMFMSDWHDTGECHNYEKTHPSGRIYRVTYGDVKPVTTDLPKLDNAELAKLQLHANDWWVRQARVVLAERFAIEERKADPRLFESLWKMALNEKTEAKQLRGLWALHSVGGTDETKLLSLLDLPGEHRRTWAVRLLVDQGAPSKDAVAALTRLAASDKSAMVRLAIAGAMQKLPHADRWPVASALAAHAEDAEDAYLPLMVWYGIEPAVPGDVGRAVELLGKAKLPALRRNLTRRLAALAE